MPIKQHNRKGQDLQQYRLGQPTQERPLRGAGPDGVRVRDVRVGEAHGGVRRPDRGARRAEDDALG